MSDLDLILDGYNEVELRREAKRYLFARKLSTHQWGELTRACLQLRKPFDQLIDVAIGHYDSGKMLSECVARACE